MENPQNLKIAVIGAGLAGLTTAYRLKQQHFDVTVYEARKRPGGRVYSFYNGDSYDELGGRFLSDAIDPKNIIRLANEFGIEIVTESIESKRAYYARGKAHPYYELYRNLPYHEETVWHSLQKIAKEKHNLSEILDEFFAGHDDLRHIFEIHLRNFEGADSKNLSTDDIDDLWLFYKTAYLNYVAEKESKNGHYTIQTIKGGNRLLIEALCQHLKGHIHYQMPLTGISRADKKIKLRFKDQTVTADIIVLAMPCSTLRDVQIENGLIPADQMLAIKTIPYGTNAKLLIPIQINANSYPKLTYTEETYTWFNTGHSILTCYYGGESGKFDHHSKAVLRQKFEKEAKAVHALYPNATFPTEIDLYKEDDKPYIKSKNPVGISWSEEPYSKGSYSFFGLENWEIFHQKRNENGEQVREIFRPINKQIFFAGEHTALVDPATLEGAVESGERTARIISRVMKSN